MTEPYLHNQTLLIGCTFLALLLPLLSFLLSLLTSERYSWLVSLNAPLLMLISTICSIVVLSSFWNTGTYVLKIDWFSFGDYSVTADIVLSNESILMLALVSGISFLVHLYSIGYMAGEGSIKKYFAMLGFFTFSMMGIVLSDNLLVLFIFWELVGFSSYMLIGHWMERPAAAQAARKAFIINRIGDAGFLIGLMIIWSNAGSFNLSDIMLPGIRYDWQTAASLCILCGVMGKSAQFPLFTWLPDAMEGPTPVSALIHAATMVAAGVYLLIRVFPLFTPDSLPIVALVGMITALIGAVAALSQYDIKRILAYSTISQLGLMVTTIGVGNINAGLLHLFTHAFFKACLFLSAGSIIHSLHQAQQRSEQHFDVQDIRNLGGLRHKLRITFITSIISGASLAGLPFSSGFLSKEGMVSTVWKPESLIEWFALLTMLAVSFLTVLYMYRFIRYVFMGAPGNTQSLTLIESPVVMRIPMIILAFFSLWIAVSWNPFDFRGWIFPQAGPVSAGLTLFSVSWIGLALFLGYKIFVKSPSGAGKVLENVFYVDRFYEKFFGALAFAGSFGAAYADKKWIDRVIHSSAYIQVTLAHITAWIDRIAVDGTVNGLGRLAGTIGAITRSFQKGKIQVYIFWSIFAIIIFLIWAMKQ